LSIWLLAGFVLTSSYAGNVRAILIRPEIGKTVNSIEGAVKSGQKWGFTEMYFSEHFFNVKDKYVKIFFEEYVAVPYHASVYEKVSNNE